MTKQEAMALLGIKVQAELARRLAIKPEAVYQWQGKIPELRRLQILALASATRQQATAECADA